MTVGIKDKLSKIFPDFTNKQICEINLNTYAIFWLKLQNPSLPLAELLNPLISWKMVQDAQHAQQAEWSYGGYLEDRSTLLAGGYQKKTASFIHLGIDVNLPSGANVTTPFSGTVLLIDDEKDYNGGWGPRVIIMPDNQGEYAMIFSHLQNIKVTVGEKILLGHLIGEIGNAPWNGNWWPHLHIQAVNLNFLSKLILEDSILTELDGYCSLDVLEELRILCPNPLSII